jgi:HPt (histidine-containing phosphotransfer) domain-containing protein
VPIHPTPPSAGQHQDRGTAPLGTDAAQVPDAPGKAAQLLDPAVLRDMQRDFSDPAAVQRFARDFCADLPGKIDRLDSRLTDGDAAGAEDAVLSVTTSAAMAGALRLGQAGRATHRLIATGNLEGARRTVTLLRACAADTIREFQDDRPEHP